VVSEGIVTYLTGRALGVVEGMEAEQSYFDSQLSDASAIQGIAWPDTCGVVESLFPGPDHAVSMLAYVRGAAFLRLVEGQVGKMGLDSALARLYRERAGADASVEDLLGTIMSETGFDPHPLASAWLRSDQAPMISP
jgi:hypothetical protein